MARLGDPSVSRHVASKGIYLATQASIVSFLKGTNTTQLPLAVDQATMQDEMMAIPPGAMAINCGEPLFPFMIEAQASPFASLSNYHEHVGKGPGGCMQGCQGIRQGQGETMMAASRRCRRICQAAGFPAKGHCTIQQGQAPARYFLPLL